MSERKTALADELRACAEQGRGNRYVRLALHAELFDRAASALEAKDAALREADKFIDVNGGKGSSALQPQIRSALALGREGGA